MELGSLYRAETKLPAPEFIAKLRNNAAQFGYVVREVFDQRAEYTAQGHAVSDDFHVWQVMLCAFNYKGLQKNLERMAVLLAPKQVMVYARGGSTHIRYLPFTADYIRAVFPGDEEFAVNQSAQCRKITELIAASL